jgi:hypothetical protein
MLIVAFAEVPVARAAQDSGSATVPSSRRKAMLVSGLVSLGAGATLVALSINRAGSEPELTDESRRQIEICLQNPSPIFGTRGCREEYYPHQPPPSPFVPAAVGVALTGVGIALLIVRPSSTSQIQIGTTFVMYHLRF